jgi:hypothetical protein
MLEATGEAHWNNKMPPAGPVETHVELLQILNWSSKKIVAKT